MSTDCLKLENNLCRCCHAEGSFKTLGVTIGTHDRVYADMLRDYLDVNLTPVPGPLCLITYTICEECVQRLYDAVDFKKQILECEERFRDMYRRDVIKACKPDFQVKVEVDSADIPSTFVEELKVECPPEVNEIQDDTDFEFQDTIEEDTPEETSTKQVTTKEQESKKVEDSKKKDKGKGKAKVVKATGKKVGRPKKGEVTNAGKKTKKDGPLPKVYSTYYTIVNEGDGEHEKYLCVKCFVKYDKLATLKCHIETHHMNSLMKCPFCEAIFRKKSKIFRIHLREVHGMEWYKSGSQDLIRPVQKWVCDVCQAQCDTEWFLCKHKKNNHKLYKCPDCTLFFKKKRLAMHRHKAHGNPIPTCGICGYKHAFQNQIDLHQRKIHLKERNVSCEICNMKFFDKSHLKKHKLQHDTSKNNKACHLCDAKFVQKASLNYHILKHHPDTC